MRAELPPVSREELEANLRSTHVNLDFCIEQRQRLEEQLEALDTWASLMPDAGFNSDDPRWEWWHQRPRVSSPASEPKED